MRLSRPQHWGPSWVLTFLRPGGHPPSEVSAGGHHLERGAHSSLPRANSAPSSGTTLLRRLVAPMRRFPGREWHPQHPASGDPVPAPFHQRGHPLKVDPLLRHLVVVPLERRLAGRFPRVLARGHTCSSSHWLRDGTMRLWFGGRRCRPATHRDRVRSSGFVGPPLTTAHLEGRPPTSARRVDGNKDSQRECWQEGRAESRRAGF